MPNIYISSYILVNYQLKFLLTYFVDEILGNYFETLVRSNSILEHRRTKWTKKRVPYGRFSKIYYSEENQILGTTPL